MSASAWAGPATPTPVARIRATLTVRSIDILLPRQYDSPVGRWHLNSVTPSPSRGPERITLVTGGLPRSFYGPCPEISTGPVPRTSHGDPAARDPVHVIKNPDL